MGNKAYYRTVLSYPRSGRNHFRRMIEHSKYYKPTFFTHKPGNYVNMESKTKNGVILIRHPIFSIVSFWEYRNYQLHKKPYQSKENGFDIFVDRQWKSWVRTYSGRIYDPNMLLVTYSDLCNRPATFLSKVFSFWHDESNKSMIGHIVKKFENKQSHPKVKKTEVFKKRDIYECPYYDRLGKLIELSNIWQKNNIKIEEI